MCDFMAGINKLADIQEKHTKKTNFRIMETKELIIEPKSQPNWKDGLLIVLLTFFIMKSDNSLVNVFAIIITSVLTIQFIATSFILFRYNLTQFGSKLIINTENNNANLQTLKNNKSRIKELKYYKVPCNNLYFLRFRTEFSKRMKTLVLNEQELSITKYYLIEKV